MGSLVKKDRNADKGDDRELQMSAGEHDAIRLKKQREYNKQQRQAHLAEFNADKAHIDTLDLDGIMAYIQECETGDRLTRGDSKPRVGMHSMKVNGYELAIIKAAQKKVGTRSTRELFVYLCDQVIRGK
jgi:hypothetical protein